MTAPAARPLAPADVIAAGLCVGCGACAEATAFDRHGNLEPVGRPPGAVAGDRFAGVCPFSPRAADEDTLAARRFPAAPHRHPATGRFEAAFVGAVADEDARAAGSSGGMATWVAAELLRRGMVDGVAHVVPTDPAAGGRLFAYRISRDVAALREGARSRYYPVDLSGVLAEIRARPGRYAVVGVPCFVKAVHLLRRADPLIRARVAFTLGVFCGHMKSARFAESFARQLGVPADRLAAVEFRVKTAGRPANWYRTRVTAADGHAVEQDWWHLLEGDWGAGFFQNPACDACDDVVAETADVSFGDAWVEPHASDPRGTNVVVVRAPAIAALLADGIADGRLDLAEVDGDFVAATQAAGLRHRREGLAYRLSLRAGDPLVPVKRVAPSADLPLRRRLVYRVRRHVARWSHRVYALSATVGRPRLYAAWARAVYAVYGAVTYGRGPLGRVLDRLLPSPRGGSGG